MTIAELVHSDPRYFYPAKITIKHPQLRDLVHTSDSCSVYYPHNRSIIKHFLDAPGKPRVKSQLSYPPVTLSTGYGMLASAGGSGEVTIQSLDDSDSEGGFYETRFGSSINNHIAFAPEATSSIEPRLLICSNDNIIRVFKVAYSRLEHHTPQLYQTETLKFNTAINQASISPNSRICVAVGDTPEVHLFDCGSSGSFRRMQTLTSTSDAGFSTAWSSDGLKFAVSSQDGFCTVWDIRSSKPLEKFTTCNQTPSRAVKFTTNAASKELMVFTEHSNRIHVVDALTFSPSTKQVLEIPFTDSNTTPPFLSPRSESPSPTSPAMQPSIYDEDYSSAPELFSTFFPSNSNPTRSLRQLFNSTYANLDRLTPSVIQRERYIGDVDIAGITFSSDNSRLYAGSMKNLIEWDIYGANSKLFETGEFL